MGDEELLRKAWELIKTRGPEFGLHLNAAKCEFSWLDADCTLPCPIRLDGAKEEDQVKLIPTSEIQMLGVPLGSDAFTAAFVDKKLFSRLHTPSSSNSRIPSRPSTYYGSPSASYAPYTS